MLTHWPRAGVPYLPFPVCDMRVVTPGCECLCACGSMQEEARARQQTSCLEMGGGSFIEPKGATSAKLAGQSALGPAHFCPAMLVSRWLPDLTSVDQEYLGCTQVTSRPNFSLGRCGAVLNLFSHACTAPTRGVLYRSFLMISSSLLLPNSTNPCYPPNIYIFIFAWHRRVEWGKKGTITITSRRREEGGPVCMDIWQCITVWGCIWVHICRWWPELVYVFTHMCVHAYVSACAHVRLWRYVCMFHVFVVMCLCATCKLCV